MKRWKSRDVEIRNLKSRNQKCGKVEMEIQRCRNSKCAQAGKAAGKIEDLRFTDQRAALMI